MALFVEQASDYETLVPLIGDLVQCHFEGWNLDSTISLIFWSTPTIFKTVIYEVWRGRHGNIYSSCWQPITARHADHVIEHGQFYLS